MEHKIVSGLSTIYEKETSKLDAMAPTSMGSGIMEVLVSTPAVLQMIIDAASRLLDPLLPSGYTTVGKHIELSHESPTMVGEKITLVITVTKVWGESVLLEITGHDSTGVICKATYERSIVEQEHLLEIAFKRSKNQ